MKYKLSLLLFLILPLLTLGQRKAKLLKTDTILFKGAKHVIVSNDNSMSENFKAVGQAFMETGFLIGDKDPEFGILTTAFIRENGGFQNQQQLIIARISDKKIVFTTKYRRSVYSQPPASLASDPNLYQATYWFKSSEGKYFSNLKKVTDLIPGNIIYSE